MPTPPKINAQAIAKTIEAQLANYDRTPFISVMAEALSAKPGYKDWRGLAKSDPAKWARAMADFGKLAGFAEKVDHRHLHVHKDDRQFFQELIQTLGLEAARNAAKQMGYSEDEAGKLIEADAES